jgi:hypothetical protein
MHTLRIVSRQETPRPVGGQDRTQEVEVSPPPDSSGGRGEVPIRLESLPTPLRAVVRDHAEGCLRIEAELPWLAVGTVVHAGNDDGTDRVGRVRAFDVELTGEGSARLLIYATLAGAHLPATSLPKRARRPQRRSPVLIAAFVLGAAAAGWVTRSFLEPVRPAAAITVR